MSDSPERLAIRGCPVGGSISAIKFVDVLRLAGVEPHPDVCEHEGRELARFLKRHLPATTVASLVAALGEPVGV